MKTDFHPVGQGLFATGSLRRHSTTRPVFRWVYDCGTTSEQRYVRRAITRLDAEWNWPEGRTRRIDMFVLSHFDHDHLSGLAFLLSKFSIGALVLPYVPLWHRLVLAFDEGVDHRVREAAMKTYTVTFNTRANTAGTEIRARSPEAALAKGRRIAAHNPDQLYFQAYDEGQPVDDITVADEDGRELCAWYRVAPGAKRLAGR